MPPRDRTVKCSKDADLCSWQQYETDQCFLLHPFPVIPWRVGKVYTYETVHPLGSKRAESLIFNLSLSDRKKEPSHHSLRSQVLNI